MAYLTKEIEDISDFLEDYQDIKLIYEALLEYTRSVCRLEEREPRSEEKEKLQSWLTQLKALDPMRDGRWADLRAGLDLN